MSKYYVYAYLDPRFEDKEFWSSNDYYLGFKPIYIGKGTGDRLYSHLNLAKNTADSSYLLNYIRKMIKSGVTPLITKLEETDDEEWAYELESWLIKCLGIYKNKGFLLNQRMGGTGGRSEITTKAMNRTEIKKKIAESNRKRVWRPESRLKISLKTKERQEILSITKSHPSQIKREEKLTKFIDSLSPGDHIPITNELSNSLGFKNNWRSLYISLSGSDLCNKIKITKIKNGHYVNSVVLERL